MSRFDAILTLVSMVAGTLCFIVAFAAMFSGDVTEAAAFMGLSLGLVNSVRIDMNRGAK